MLKKILSKVLVVVLGLVILFVSVARAGLSLMAQDNGLDLLKNDEVKFMTIFGDGETASGTYKMPQVGMLPSHVFYGFKRVRDYIWVALSQGMNKPKLVLLMADKKVVEFEKLSQAGLRDTAIEAGNEAIDKLKYANDLVVTSKFIDAQTKQLRMQILWAGLAYKEVFNRNEKDHRIDNEKYTILIAKINEWNKAQEENRFNWNY